MPDAESTSLERRVLIVAYHFPPAGGLAAAGSQRILKLAKYLPGNGWMPIVVTARVDCYEDYVFMDEAMMQKVPTGLEVRRTRVLHLLDPLLRLKERIFRLLTVQGKEAVRSDRIPEPDYADSPERATNAESRNQQRHWFQRLKDGFTDLFEIPDEVSGWILPALVAGARVIHRDDVDAIIATGRPWSALVSGAILKTLFRKPFIADFRDPWMTNPFRLRYSRFKNAAERAIESWVIDRADIVIANTDELAAEFADRFGDKVAQKCIVARNGYDQDELVIDDAPAARENDASMFNLVHTGALYGKRDPGVLLEAIAILKEQGLIDAERFRLTLVGPIDLPYDLEGRLNELGVGDVVRMTGIVSHAESLRAIAASQMCILLQPGTTTQVPSKLYEYVGCGKPILAVVNAESAAANLVASRSLGVLAPGDDPDELAAVLLREFERYLSGESVAMLDKCVREEFDVRQSTANIATAMNRLSR